MALLQPESYEDSQATTRPEAYEDPARSVVKRGARAPASFAFQTTTFVAISMTGAPAPPSSSSPVKRRVRPVRLAVPGVVRDGTNGTDERCSKILTHLSPLSFSIRDP